MALQYSTTHRTTCMSDLITALGATSCLLIYTGAAPSNVATAASGTLLATLTCSATFGVSASGVLTANAITSVAAAATGTAGYWRLCTSSAGTTCIIQGLCGTSGSDLNLSSTSIASGQTVSVSSMVITAFGA
jgi:hypothetical protein